MITKKGLGLVYKLLGTLEFCKIELFYHQYSMKNINSNVESTSWLIMRSKS